MPFIKTTSHPTWCPAEKTVSSLFRTPHYVPFVLVRVILPSHPSRLSLDDLIVQHVCVDLPTLHFSSFQIFKSIMSYYGRGGGGGGGSSYGSSSHVCRDLTSTDVCFLQGSYGGNRSGGNDRDRYGGSNLLDDLDSFDVAPLRAGPPVIKNFYIESPLITARPQVRIFLHPLISPRHLCLVFSNSLSNSTSRTK